MKSIVTIGLAFAAVAGTQIVTHAASNAFIYEKLMENKQYDAAAAVDKLVRAKCYKHQIKLYDAFKDSLAAMYFIG